MKFAGQRGNNKRKVKCEDEADPNCALFVINFLIFWGCYGHYRHESSTRKRGNALFDLAKNY